MEQTGSYRVALGAGDAAGGILSVQNPEGADLIITRIVLDVTTKTADACTADFGMSGGSVASSDNLIDGLDLNAATGVFDNLGNAGTNGKTRQKWPASQYLTGSKATGAAAGLVGYAHIHYVRA